MTKNQSKVKYNQKKFAKTRLHEEALEKETSAEATIQNPHQTLAQQDQILEFLHSSLVWKVATSLYKIENKFLPPHTQRRRVYDSIIETIKEKVFNIKPLGNSDYDLYQQWIVKNEPDDAQLQNMHAEQKSWRYRPKISIITPVYNPNKNDIIECLASVQEQVYDNWQLCVANGSSKKYVEEVINEFAAKDKRIQVNYLSENKGIAGNSNEALKLATGEFVGFLDHDDTLAPFALFEVVKLLNKDRKIDFLYSDEDKIDPKGTRRFEPHFKPGWSPDTLLSYNYACHFAVVRKKLVDEIGGFRVGYDGDQDYDLILRITQKANGKIERIPKVLYHWRAAKTSTASNLDVKMYAGSAAKKAKQDYLKSVGLDAKVLDGKFSGPHRVKYKTRANLKVSIIIPAKDKVHLLSHCVFSILKKTYFENFEILIVDNQSLEQRTYDFYDSLQNEERIRILQYEKPFNFSAINNFAVKSTDSPYVVFLNNDTEVINNEWLTAMLEFAQREDVGAVGAKLYYPNDAIQHAGVIIGIGGVAGHSHKYFPRASRGYKGRLEIIQNLSAVTAACMMLRREVFEQVGGFEEKLSLAFNDVDLCLKIREKGYLIVYTPYAELYHYESLSRGYESTPERRMRFNKEVAYMKDKWNHILKKGDPYYNPNLTLQKEDFSIKL